MTIRTRLTLWYSVMLLASLLLMSAVLYYELVYEQRAEVPVQQREQAPEQLVEIILFYGVPTLVLLLVGGWFFMRRTLAPVTALTDAIERVHAEDLRHRLSRSGNGDELDRLTGVFNDMLGRLDESFRRIRSFTLHASHELKTPLTILRGEMETLLRDAKTHPDHHEALEGMLDEMQRMARIVDDLALLTRADAGQAPLAFEPVHLNELVREACEDARILGEKQGIRIELAVCQEVTMTGDRHRLRQLLLNLADNSVKHNEPGGRVTVSLRRVAGGTQVEFENTGPGVAPDQLPLVFDPFFRGTEAQRARRDGCGLGLSIAQWIVTAHGGTVAITCDPGNLTTITVRFPPVDHRDRPGSTRSPG